MQNLGSLKIIIYSCVFKSLFTSVNLKSVSLKPSTPPIWYFLLYIVFEQLFRFAYLQTRDWSLLMDNATGQDILLLLSSVYLQNAYDFMNKLF